MQLFKDRHLNIAILISTSWHLICIFSITPVLISGNIRENSITISFLGSILEKVVALPEKSFSLNKVSIIQKIERRKDINNLEKLTLTSPEGISKAKDIQPDKGAFVFSVDKYKDMAFKLHYKKKERLEIRFKDVSVIGEARNRMVLYKPDLYRIPTFFSNFSSGCNLSIGFKISRYGFVEKPECIISSGSSEIDQMAIRYIRRWQFVPQEDDLEKVQDGIIRVHFDVK